MASSLLPLELLLWLLLPLDDELELLDTELELEDPIDDLDELWADELLELSLDDELLDSELDDELDCELL